MSFQIDPSLCAATQCRISQMINGPWEVGSTMNCRACLGSILLTQSFGHRSPTTTYISSDGARLELCPEEQQYEIDDANALIKDLWEHSHTPDE